VLNALLSSQIQLRNCPEGNSRAGEDSQNDQKSEGVESLTKANRASKMSEKGGKVGNRPLLDPFLDTSDPLLRMNTRYSGQGLPIPLVMDEMSSV
jgi:hypothetical protein